MPRSLEHSDLEALCKGSLLLGSGGGGRTTLLELMLTAPEEWPRRIYEVDELPSDTPCIAVAYVGSTFLLTERLPAAEPFQDLIAAAERWTGTAASAVCSMETAGLNALTPLLLSESHRIVDADFMGRALPQVDQLSVFVDRLPGVIAVCGSGDGGIVLCDTSRAADIERIVRTSVVQAGGFSAFVLAGFTVGDLHDHAILGAYHRAVALGRAYLATANNDVGTVAAALGGRLLGCGRVTAVEESPVDEHASSVEITGDHDEMFRIIARSESLAFMHDGELLASSPEIIVTIDLLSRDILQIGDLSYARHVGIIALPAPEWWLSTPTRLARVLPSAYGFEGLDHLV